MSDDENRKELERVTAELDAAKKREKAMREALECQHNECQTCHPGEPCRDRCICSCGRCHAEALRRAALAPDAGRDYVLRTELDAAKRREGEALARLYNSWGEGMEREHFEAMKEAKEALSGTAGSALLTPEQVKPLVEALRHAFSTIWDAYYGRGIDLEYVRNTSKQLQEGLAHARSLGLCTKEGQ